MKRLLFFLMLTTGIIAFVSGAAEGDEGGEAEAHIVFAIIFGITCLTHIVINRKLVWKYIRGK
jgi:hypothetical protein